MPQTGLQKYPTLVVRWGQLAEGWTWEVDLPDGSHIRDFWIPCWCRPEELLDGWDVLLVSSILSWASRL